MHVESSREDATPSHAATVADLRVLEDDGRGPALVIRWRGCGDRHEWRGYRNPRRGLRKRYRMRRRNRARASGKQPAFGTGVAGGTLERGMLDALQLRAEVIERVSQPFVLHQQQEHRQQARQDTALHWAQINRRIDA